jgi:hypothetical protein
MTRLAAATGVELPPATLFERPTISELAALLDAVQDRTAGAGADSANRQDDLVAQSTGTEQARARGRRRTYAAGRKPRISEEER